MKVQMLRRRRSEEGKRIRAQMLRQGNGDHCSFKYKQMEIDSNCPYSSTITTFLTKDNLLIEVWKPIECEIEGVEIADKYNEEPE